MLNPRLHQSFIKLADVMRTFVGGRWQRQLDRDEPGTCRSRRGAQMEQIAQRADGKLARAG
jgi:hypothetical protein